MIVVIERRPTCMVSIAFASWRRCAAFFFRGIIASLYESPALIAMLLSPRFASWSRTERWCSSAGCIVNLEGRAKRAGWPGRV
jgi:hypothetical protein